MANKYTNCANNRNRKKGDEVLIRNKTGGKGEENKTSEKRKSKKEDAK